MSSHTDKQHRELIKQQAELINQQRELIEQQEGQHNEKMESGRVAYRISILAIVIALISLAAAFGF